MANQYLFEIHRYLSEALEQINCRQAELSLQDNGLEAAFWEGQHAELTYLKEHIAKQYDLATQSYP